MKVLNFLLACVFATAAVARSLPTPAAGESKGVATKSKDGIHASKTPSIKPSKTGTKKGHGSATASALPGGPIPGLSATQAKNAHAVMGEVKKEGLPTQACLAAIATCLQESQLQVLANNAVPQSLSLPHDGMGSNLNSVGVYQQRPNYYPNVQADMNPAQSTAQFLTAMKAVSGWQTMNVADLCQSVQKAAAGNLYGQRVSEAQRICKAGGFS